MNRGHRWAVSGDINAFFGLLHPRLKRIETPPTLLRLERKVR